MFSFPTMTAVVASSTSEAATLFEAFLPLATLAIIIVIAVAGLIYFRKWITGGIKRVAGGGRRGRRRR